MRNKQCLGSERRVIEQKENHVLDLLLYEYATEVIQSEKLQNGTIQPIYVHFGA